MSSDEIKQLKDEFIKSAEMIADKIIEAYTASKIPDNLSEAANDIDILKICISMSLNKWQSNMFSMAESFKKDISNEEFIKNVKAKFEANNDGGSK